MQKTFHLQSFDDVAADVDDDVVVELVVAAAA